MLVTLAQSAPRSLYEESGLKARRQPVSPAALFHHDKPAGKYESLLIAVEIPVAINILYSIDPRIISPGLRPPFQ